MSCDENGEQADVDEWGFGESDDEGMILQYCVICGVRGYLPVFIRQFWNYRGIISKTFLKIIGYAESINCN